MNNIMGSKLECDFCGLITKNSLSYKCHVKSCDIIKDNIDCIIEDYINGSTIRSIIGDYKISYNLLMRVFLKNNIKVRNLSESLIGKTKFRHTEESKNKISESKKKFYKNNPEKHNWKSSLKFISKPCEEFKKILDEFGINYVPELTPLEDRFFSIDIAFPNKKIGIEINGNQHYNKDGTLKEYYLNRHIMIEESGWKLYEIHFSVCYKRDVVLGIIDNINKDYPDIFNFDYNIYLIDKLNKNNNKFICEDCGGEKLNRYSKKCLKCLHIKSRKFERPTYSQLLLDVDELGYSGSGRKYGVSDNSIRKWLNKFKKGED